MNSIERNGILLFSPAIKTFFVHLAKFPIITVGKLSQFTIDSNVKLRNKFRPSPSNIIPSPNI